MENLFSEDPEFRRVQYTKLSDNTQEWSREVATLVSERLPRDLGLDVMVVFQKTDDEKGYGIGTAVARDPRNERQIGIPVIIKAWHASPFDMFFQDGKLQPLSEDALAKAFYHTGMGAGVAPEKAPPVMTDDTFADMRNPPLGGKYSYSSSLSVVDLIHDTLTPEQVSEFKKEAVKNQDAVAAIFRRGHSRLIEKLAEAPKETPQDELDKDRAKAVLQIEKEAPDFYRCYTTDEGAFSPITLTGGRQAVIDWLESRKAHFGDTDVDHVMRSVDKNGEYLLTPPDAPYGKPAGEGIKSEALGERKNTWVFDPLQDDRTAKELTEFGPCGVRDAGGVLAKGWLLPNVVNFSGSPAGLKLFVSPALGAMQSRIVGIPLADDDDAWVKPSTLGVGKTGTLVYRDGKKVLATVPFQITAVTRYGSQTGISVVDYKGNRSNLVFMPAMDGIEEIKSDRVKLMGPLVGPGSNYYVSGEFKFIAMPRMRGVSESVDDFKKLAAAELDPSPLRISKHNGTYSFRSAKIAAATSAARAAKGALRLIEGPTGRQLAATAGRAKMPKVPKPKEVKVASFDLDQLSRGEAAFLLGAFGLPREKVASILSTVDERRAADVHHLTLRPARQTKVASLSAAGRLALAAELRVPHAETLKIASALDSAEAVDAVLSLGFVNPANLERFAAIRTSVEDMSASMAKLLLASRLGMQDIPEECARSAMMHLKSVADGLSKLQMLRDQAGRAA